MLGERLHLGGLSTGAAMLRGLFRFAATARGKEKPLKSGLKAGLKAASGPENVDGDHCRHLLPAGIAGKREVSHVTQGP